MTARDNNDKIMDRLPDVLRRMAELVGLEGALKIASEFGGEEIFVPKLASLKREVRNAAIRTAYDGGTPVKKLIHAHDLTERQIYNILNSVPEESDKSFTLPLF